MISYLLFLLLFLLFNFQFNIIFIKNYIIFGINIFLFFVLISFVNKSNQSIKQISNLQNIFKYNCNIIFNKIFT